VRTELRTLLVELDLLFVSLICMECISETAEWIWLKFCTGMEVCAGHCISYFGGDCYRGPAREAKNVFFRSTVVDNDFSI